MPCTLIAPVGSSTWTIRSRKMLAIGTITPATAPMNTAAGGPSAARAGGDRDQAAERPSSASVRSGLPYRKRPNSVAAMPPAAAARIASSAASPADAFPGDDRKPRDVRQPARKDEHRPRAGERDVVPGDHARRAVAVILAVPRADAARPTAAVTPAVRCSTLAPATSTNPSRFNQPPGPPGHMPVTGMMIAARYDRAQRGGKEPRPLGQRPRRHGERDERRRRCKTRRRPPTARAAASRRAKPTERRTPRCAVGAGSPRRSPRTPTPPSTGRTGCGSPPRRSSSSGSGPSRTGPARRTRQLTRPEHDDQPVHHPAALL